MRKLIASIAIATIGVTAGATASTALANSHHCGKGLADVPAAWHWQYNDHAPVSTKLGNVGVWTNRHDVVVGYSAHEDTNVMPSANCAAKDI